MKQIIIKKVFKKRIICPLILFVAVYTIFLTASIFNIKISNQIRTNNSAKHNETPNITRLQTIDYSNANYKNEVVRQKAERLAAQMRKRRIELASPPATIPNYNVHVFYYAWYKNLEVDGEYSHWNHKYLPNWRSDDLRVYPTGSHKPPEDIGSNYYPELGCYSSRDREVIDQHMRWLKDVGVGVIALSWYPPGFPDSIDDLLPIIFDIAVKHELKVALHVEPYQDRNPINFRLHLKNFLNQYGNHSALYKTKKLGGSKLIPLIYIYDSYLTPHYAWRQLFSQRGNLSLRDTNLDAVFIGLLVETHHRHHIKKSQFDGFYTYFAVNGFSYGSSWKNWNDLRRFAQQNDLYFIPSVGPGYIDTKVRPWNSVNSRHRRHGQYYDVAWRTAIKSKDRFVTITSFNEWHEGTQIEPAVPRWDVNYSYLDYEPEGSQFYLNLTKFWVKQFDKDIE